MTSATASDNGAPTGRIDRLVQDYVRRRRGVSELPRDLEYKRIFVLPTRFGFWFGVLLILMIVGGLNFNNTMTLMLAFRLASIALLTSLLAYRNLAGISVVAIRAKPVFSGETAKFRILLSNSDDRNRFGIQVSCEEGQDCADIAPQNTQRLQLPQVSGSRGWMEMQTFRIENRFPLGMFRAWSVVIPQARCLVYPAPATHPPPLPRTGRGEYGAAHRGEGEHFHGLREYRPGDPIRQIAWRTSARHEKLYSRQMESPNEEACELNWSLMGSGDRPVAGAVSIVFILPAFLALTASAHYLGRTGLKGIR